MRYLIVLFFLGTLGSGANAHADRHTAIQERDCPKLSEYFNLKQNSLLPSDNSPTHQAYCESVLEIGSEILNLIIATAPIFNFDDETDLSRFIKNCGEQKLIPSYQQFIQEERFSSKCTDIVNSHLSQCGLSGHQGDNWFKSYYFVISNLTDVNFNGKGRLCVH